MSRADQPGRGPSACEDALAHLQEYIDCEMSEVDTVRLEMHISTCPTCQEQVGLEQRLRALLRRSCMEQAPAHLRERVLRQITIVSERVVIDRLG